MGEAVSGEKSGETLNDISITEDFLQGLSEGLFSQWMVYKKQIIEQNMDWDKFKGFTLFGNPQDEKSGLM